MITPKLDYIKTDKHVDSIQEIVMSPNFRRAAEVALMEYILGLNSESPTTGPRIAGAKGFLEELMNIGIEFPAQPPHEDQQLSPV